MQSNLSSYGLLIQKLDQFIRKFYLNQLVRGTLYTTAIILGLFLAFNLLEHNFYFDKGIRKFLFYSFIFISVVSIGSFILIPLLKYFRLGKVISHENAASIIGNHFGDVKDQLLNILQLKKQSSQLEDTSLIEASINQKSDKIKLVPFKSAIDLGNNKKYLKYALPPFLLLLFIVLTAPSLLKDSTNRLINNDREFERAAPFHFDIQNEDLSVVQFEDYTLDVEVTGEVIPNEAFVKFDDFQYRLKKIAPGKFQYVFNNVQKNIEFEVFSGSVVSITNKLEVLPKPNLSGFDLKLDYPSYINRKDESISNIGDMVVPLGTKLTWDFNTKNTDQIELAFTNSGISKIAEQRSPDRYRFFKQIFKDDVYKIYYSNQAIPTPDSISYSLRVIPDQHPVINVEKFQDSLDNNLIYFIGNASDDYGLEAISFAYQVKNQDGRIKKSESKILVQPKNKNSQYDHTLDIHTFQLEPGDQLSYYFETRDNDAINGSKTARTEMMNFEKPTVEEFEQQEDANEEDIEESLKESLKESKDIQEELKKLREKLLQKKEINFQEQQELDKLLERQKQLEEEIKKAKEKFEENLKNQEEFSEREEEILEKQEKIKDMFEEVLNDETQELMQKIQELMQELNKEEMMEMMEQMEMTEETMEKEMDRLLELFKQLEVEKEVKDLMEKLEELAEKQEELADQTEKEEKSQEELKKEQEKLNEEFDKAKEKMEEIEEKNEELERPKDLGEENEEQMEDIEDDMEEGTESLEKKENKKASKSQKKAASKMKQMAGNLNESMESGESEQAEEDIAALRQLLENLVTLSFDQEDLIDAIAVTDKTTPRYISLVQTQFKLKDDFGLIRDSLEELSKRVDQIATFVNEKVVEIDQNLSGSMVELEERKVPEAEEHQRRTMKNVNDLALMLSESMQQMQEQAAGMMAGSQMCDKPGGKGKGKSGKSGKEPGDKISEGQKKLNEDMKKMHDGMKKGGQGGSAKEFAQAAARQAALRKALEQMRQDQQEQGKGGAGNLDELIEQMDKIETDLVNKRLNAELLARQENIETRLLEAEKADRQREWDNKRKSEQAQEKRKELPPALQEYIKNREAEIELYNKVSPSLRPYYKQMVNEYYNSLKKN